MGPIGSPGVGAPARLRRCCSEAVLAIALGCALGPSAAAQALAPAAPPQAGGTIADVIAEASQRAGMPAVWIAAVTRAESAFDPHATSPKGAMGLMQLMPDTWAGLRARLSLGPDPYDPHDNIMAGARYLRDLYDQFGVAGFLAAYNAGPRRYLDFLTRGRPLPAETRVYVAKISMAIDGVAVSAPPLRIAASVTSPRPGLFVAVGGSSNRAATLGSSPADTTPPPSARTQFGELFVGAWGETR